MAIKEAKEIKMPIFRERFRSLRGDMTQADFAKFVGISRPTVGFYENGERLPDALALKKIAEKCEISVDWLLGLSDVKQPNVAIQAISKELGLSEQAIMELVKLKIVGEETNGEEEAVGITTIINMFIEHKYFEPIFTEIAAVVGVYQKCPKIRSIDADPEVKRLKELSPEMLDFFNLENFQIYQCSEMTRAIYADIFDTLYDRFKSKGGDLNANDHTEERDI